MPVRRACQALGLSHHALYRSRKTGPVRAPSKDTPGSRHSALAEEKAQVRSTLNSERFADQAPREIYATLLDEGTYLCSVSSMYRILRENQEVCERRNQLRHPSFARPELLATAPNQVWTWGVPGASVTKLLGPVKCSYFYLYVLLDLFSRFVVGWLIAPCAFSDMVQVLIAESRTRQNIQPEQLTIHADRGATMIDKPLAALLADREPFPPHVSNDSPFSEAQFTPALAGGARETMKYQPTYTRRFGRLPDARSWPRAFFPGTTSIICIIGLYTNKLA